ELLAGAPAQPLEVRLETAAQVRDAAGALRAHLEVRNLVPQGEQRRRVGERAQRQGGPFAARAVEEGLAQDGETTLLGAGKVEEVQVGGTGLFFVLLARAQELESSHDGRPPSGPAEIEREGADQDSPVTDREDPKSLLAVAVCGPVGAPPFPRP